MSNWAALAAAEPEFADRVRRIFDAHRHKVLATLRRDGSPRVSGIEVEFTDGELLMGMMPGSMKAQDLRRNPRLALHAVSEDPPQDDPSTWLGDAKIAGRAVEVTVAMDEDEDEDEPVHRFKVDIVEVVLIQVGRPADHLLIESWHEGRGLERKERR
ncbi:MAG TPA: pyridoxamine 5'-phosphate oxidase family protein [Candidatus Dormibacteraeota bacterium]